MNRRALVRMVVATLVANVLAVGLVWACGPHIASFPTMRVLDPDDEPAFARGEIGILRPRYRRAARRP